MCFFLKFLKGQPRCWESILCGYEWPEFSIVYCTLLEFYEWLLEKCVSYYILMFRISEILAGTILWFNYVLFIVICLTFVFHQLANILQLADIFTKPLNRNGFKNWVNKLFVTENSDTAVKEPEEDYWVMYLWSNLSNYLIFNMINCEYVLHN